MSDDTLNIEVTPAAGHARGAYVARWPANPDWSGTGDTPWEAVAALAETLHLNADEWHWGARADDTDAAPTDVGPPDLSVSRPTWDETPTTLSLIETLIEHHPNYRATSHTAPSGSRYVVVELPPVEDGEPQFDHGTPGTFVEVISAIGDDEHVVRVAERGQEDEDA